MALMMPVGLEDGRWQVVISGPNFSCADLRGADFSGAPIFHMSQDEFFKRQEIFVQGFNFNGANLEGADFQFAKVFGLGHRSYREYSGVETNGGTGIGSGAIDAFMGQLGPESRLLAEEMDLHESSLLRLMMNFSASNWQAAKLPRGFYGYFLSNSEMEEEPGSECTPRSPWQYPPEYLGPLDSSGLDWLQPAVSCRMMQDGDHECFDVSYEFGP